MSKRTETILIVEDEPVVALDLRMTLEELGYSVCGIYASADAAIMAVERMSPSMVLMDIHIQGDKDGVEAAQIIYERWHLPIVFLTAFADEETIGRAAAIKPFGYLLKPFERKELSAIIQVARHRHEAETALAESEERLAIALEAAELASWDWNTTNQRLRGDERFWKVWGLTFSSVNLTLDDLLKRVHPDDISSLQSLMRLPGFFSCIFRVAKNETEYAWVEMHGRLRQLSSNEVQIIGAVRDVTLRKQMEDRLRQASVVFNSTPEGILILNEEGKVVSLNPAFSQLTGFQEDDVIGKCPDNFLIFRRNEDLTYHALANSAEGFISQELPCRRKDGSMFPTLQHICVVKDESGSTQQFVHLISDISAIREAESRLAHLAFHDPLTGLGNRYMLMERLEEEIHKAKLHDAKIAVLFLDLDGFKLINDTLGHHVGDRVIQMVATRITNQLRRHDEVIRLGGDEFVVILPGVAGLEDAEKIATKLLADLIEAPFEIENHKYRLGASVGVALYPDHGTSVAQLLSASDSAMYEAKRVGKGRVCLYTENLIEQVRSRMYIEQCLLDALSDGQFEIYYQPVVNLLIGQLTGFEALIRWNHPTLGVVSPDYFIGIAEENGLIDKIGAWVMQTAVAQLKRWQAVMPEKIFMAVNVSPRQLNDLTFVSKVQELVEVNGLEPGQLELEVTESMIQDFNKSKQVIEDLRHLGVNVAIDDFGTGYSSLSLLKHVPITRVKIDKSFISALPGSSKDLGMIYAMLQMSGCLGLHITAEGIETVEQARLLREMGCTAVQGYWFGRPQPATKYDEDWLKKACLVGGVEVPKVYIA
ncbi:EAL domain-containing protein [Leeia sp. TBRC 13508]|uniref:EAL domain-containing protein n=1 Tax=Leeia speluncae TaxID=2884804 RepID=A0ABS8D1X5_9NEIS|nr:EAL domain-containing protein [Leeia speluncae]MCB6182196.1 EAL domain-containing protein [Leeia speluncae]